MNTTEDTKYIGYLKYSGKSVENGMLDARKSAEALLGFDEILRHFLLKEDPSLGEYDFEIPVEISKGSWVAYIPDIIDKLLSPQAIAGIYVAASAKKAATDGLFETGIAKDIKATFRIAIKSVQWMIKIASHTGSLTKKKNDKIKFKNTYLIEPTVEIPNDKNEILEVPKNIYDQFIDCPEKLFSKNARIIEKERVLEFGVYEDGKVTRATISEKEKSIFFAESEEMLFPDLKHGQSIALEGEITKGNEKSNTIGFQYQGHVLTCKPEKGSIVKFKNQIISKDGAHLFPRVSIAGVIDRKDQASEFKEKKPKIVFSKITPIETGTEEKQSELFNNQSIE